MQTFGSSKSSYLGLAPIKINLSLKILSKNCDGYHDIASLVIFGNDGNMVFSQKSTKSQIQYIYDIKGVDKTKYQITNDNSLKFLKQVYKNKLVYGNHSFIITKRIPIASGLGGSITDAALMANFFLAQKSKYTKKQLEILLKKELVNIASDGLTCFNSKPCVIFERGNKVCLVENFFNDFAIVVACPDFGLTSEKVFEAFSKSNHAYDHSDSYICHQEIVKSGISNYKQLINFLNKNQNDLLAAAIKINPNINSRLSFVRSIQGVDYANISGSGSSIFAICQKKQLKKVYNSIINYKKYYWQQIFICHPYSQ